MPSVVRQRMGTNPRQPLINVALVALGCGEKKSRGVLVKRRGIMGAFCFKTVGAKNYNTCHRKACCILNVRLPQNACTGVANDRLETTPVSTRT